MMRAPAQAFPQNATSASTTVYVGAAILHGWGFRETSDTARAELEVRDGAQGQLIVPITLLAGESTRDWLSGTGLYVRTGLYVAMLTGTAQWSLWATPLNDAGGLEPLDVPGLFDGLAETIWQASR